jgi:hypothetical protein
MSIKATVKKDEESGDYYFDILDLAHLFEDVSLVDTYSMEERDDGALFIEFFDKDGNKILLKKTP